MSGAGGANPSGSSSASGPCNQCNVVGHFMVNCPQLPCSRCKGTGHIQAVCTTPMGKVCFICSETGHYAKDCPTPTVPGPRCQNCGGYGHGTASHPANPTCATVQALPHCNLCKQDHRPRDCKHPERPIRYSQWKGGKVCTQCGDPTHRFGKCPKKMH